MKVQRHVSGPTFSEPSTPKRGRRAGLVLPYCDTAAHAVLILDQAGEHPTPKLTVPADITFLFLPSNAPVLNQVENVWHFIRDNWLSYRIFIDDHDIVGRCCAAWIRLVDQRYKVMSIGMRNRAHGS